ncbi:MAG: M48 family metallopeptidase [Paracoccaceae bacterium]
MTRAPVRTRIGIGARHVDMRADATFADGRTAAARPAELSFDDAAGTLLIAPRDAVPVRWPLAELRRLRDQAGIDAVVLGREGDPARVLLPDGPDLNAIRARAPDLDRAPRYARKGRLLLAGLSAIASVALIVWVLIPAIADRLAPYLPEAGEAALGDLTFERIRVALDPTGLAPLRICEDPDGLAALGVMRDRLDATGLYDGPLRVTVLDSDVVNAFALPGGRVVFFRGLIERARRAEELTAVLAHEIAHVANRDPTRLALRSAGSIGILGLLLGDFAGGAAVLFLVEAIVRADHTREAELAADAFAFDMLNAADLPPSAMADLFARLLDDVIETPAILGPLDTHPDMRDRIARARAATPDGVAFEPLLTPARWAALRGVCD